MTMDDSTPRSMEWLKDRMEDTASVPEEFRMVDELWSVLQVTSEGGVVLPELEKAYYAEWARIHKIFAGNRSISPEEVLFRAKVLASVAALVGDGLSEDPAREIVATIAGCSRDDIRKWKSKYDEPQDTTSLQYRFTVPCMVGHFRDEIAKKHNILTVEKTVQELFAQ